MMLSLQLAGAITAVVLLVGGLAFMVMANRQRAQIDEMLRYTLGQDRTGEVDPCTWLFVQRGDQLIGASEAPPGLPMMAPIRSATADGTAVSSSIRANGTRYYLLTRRADDGTRQAVLDVRYQMSDRSELLTALLVAELIGLLIACVTGVLLARLAIAPLDEALRRQRRFVADASHELRAPLTRLHTRAQLLLRRDLPPDIAAELRRVVDSSRELNEIVDDLLRSAVLTAGRPEGTPVDLALVAETVVDAEQPRATQNGVALRTSYGPGAVASRAPLPEETVPSAPAALPRADAPARTAVILAPGAAAGTATASKAGTASETATTEAASTAEAPATTPGTSGAFLVAGVESALRRMVSALVDNALRHSATGGRITVTVAPADRGRTVILIVADNGTGLNPADSRRIFERFHRGTSEQSGSHGLGLALVREIVEAHGGDVTATGQPGVGTDFVVRLPAYTVSKRARRPSSPHRT